MPGLPAFRNVEAVTFDAAHTLFHPHPSVGAIYREVMQRHGLDYSADALEQGFRRAFRSVRKDRTILDGERREMSYWRAVVADSIAELSPQPDDFDALFADLWETFAHGERWRPEPHAKTVLAELRQRGYRAALLSNWDKRVRRVVDETGFAPLLDHLFISSEIGHEKPASEIFAHAAAVLDLPPHAILHVGDSFQHDIEGALAAGWNAVRISSEPPPSLPTPYRQITSLDQLLTLL